MRRLILPLSENREKFEFSFSEVTFKNGSVVVFTIVESMYICTLPSFRSFWKLEQAGKISDGDHLGSDTNYESWNDTFSANWEPFTDVLSSILKYAWAVKEMNTGYITSFLEIGLSCIANTTGLKPVSGQTYCAVVRGYNKAGLYTETTSNCVLIDLIVPQAGTVNDGSLSDVDYQSNDTLIAANWYGFTDGKNGGGIVDYKYRVVNENGSVFLDWTSVGNATSFSKGAWS